MARNDCVRSSDAWKKVKILLLSLQAGITAMDKAKAKGHTDVVQLLKQYMSTRWHTIILINFYISMCAHKQLLLFSYSALWSIFQPV